MLLRTQGQLTNIIRNGIQSGTPDIASDGTFKINPSENEPSPQSDYCRHH
jgi:hypothetical protein